MRVYKLLLNTLAEGPGIRVCIWVSGCNHECKGCFATHLWDYNGGSEMSVAEVIEKIEKVIDEIDGITFLGGEPFDQAMELVQIAEFVKQKGKNVISFSGYLYEELLQDEEKRKLLEHTDLLCDGPFIEELTDYSRPLLGSSNQRFIFLSEAITEEEMAKYKNRLEIRVLKNGKTEINGMGNVKKIRETLLKEGVRTDGITNI